MWILGRSGVVHGLTYTPQARDGSLKASAGDDDVGALEWLKLAWGDGYEDIAMDGDRWRARRRDGDGGTLSAATADELDAVLRADWSRRETK